MKLPGRGVALVASLLGALVLAVLGFAFVLAPQSAYDMSGHAPAAVTAVMGGRYFGLALAVLAFVALRDHRALAVVFAIGCFLGSFDAIATAMADGVDGEAQGRVVPHLVAAGASAFMVIWHRHLQGTER